MGGHACGCGGDCSCGGSCSCGHEPAAHDHVTRVIDAALQVHNN